jgi:hypothetical protein
MSYRWTLTNLSDMSTEVLTNDPIGWDEGVYTIKRSNEYKGAFHEYSVPLKFHCKGGGKDFIDNIYQTEDIDGRIDVLVEYDCDGSGTYETLFNGIINLVGYQTDGEYTTVNIEKSDLLTKLFSRDEISVDLETTTSIGGETISAVQTTTLPMHSTNIIFESSWGIAEGYNQSFIQSGSQGDILGDWFTPNIGVIKNDFSDTMSVGEIETSTGAATVFEDQVVSPILTLNDPLINYPVTIDYNINISGAFTDDETTSGGARTVQQVILQLHWGYKNDAGDGSVNGVTLWEDGGYSTDNYSTTFDTVAYGNSTGSITLNAGDSVWLTWFYITDTITDIDGATVNVDWNYNLSTIEFSAETVIEASEAKSVMVHEAFNQVVDAIADSDGNFESDFYGRTDSDKTTYVSDGCGSQIAITNGLNIRQFEDKPILCSFRDLFNAMDCQHNIGMGVVDGKIRVEPLSYWFDSTTKIITLANVQSFTAKNDSSKYINKIDVGYNRWESEFKGGLDDVNSKHEYSTQVKSTKGIYSKLCKYLASTYTIELTRRKSKNRTTEDWRYDNDNFLIACVRDAYGILRPEVFNDSFTLGTNYAALASAYNISLTPKRMLLHHLNVITAGLQIINGIISFVKGEGNTIFSCAKDDVGCAEDYNGVAIAENGNINWNDANAENISPIYLPETYSFEYPLTFDEFKTIKNNPYGYVEFYKDSDDVKQGYIMEMAYSMKTGLTKFDLIRKA